MNKLANGARWVVEFALAMVFYFAAPVSGLLLIASMFGSRVPSASGFDLFVSTFGLWLYLVAGFSVAVAVLHRQIQGGKVQSLAGSLVGVVNQLLLPKADGSGYALAAEILNNYEQDFSNALGDVAKMQSVLERPDKKGSVLLAESLAELANTGVVTKQEAVRAVAGMSNVQEKLRQLLK